MKQEGWARIKHRLSGLYPYMLQKSLNPQKRIEMVSPSNHHPNLASLMRILLCLWAHQGWTWGLWEAGLLIMRGNSLSRGCFFKAFKLITPHTASLSKWVTYAHSTTHFEIHTSKFEEPLHFITVCTTYKTKSLSNSEDISAKICK